MRTVGTFLKWSLKACMAGIVSIMLLSLFALVYWYTGVHITNPSQATDYYWEPNQFKAIMSEGFSWMRMDENGFNNRPVGSAREYAERADILLMGSSHAQATNVAQDESMSVILNEILPEHSTYNIGISGHTIYHCANNLQKAVSEYENAQYVVIETANVNLTADNMEAVINGKYPHIPSHDSGLMYQLQKWIPVVLPIYRQLENWINADAAVLEDTDTTDMGAIDETSETGYLTGETLETLNRFLAFLKRNAGNRCVLIAYHPRTQIDEAGRMIADGNAAVIFKDACSRNGIIFINLEEDFKQLYEREHILAHGFANSAIGEGHLNKYGHLLMAEKISETIRKMENGTE